MCILASIFATLTCYRFLSKTECAHQTDLISLDLSSSYLLMSSETVYSPVQTAGGIVHPDSAASFWILGVADSSRFLNLDGPRVSRSCLEGRMLLQAFEEAMDQLSPAGSLWNWTSSDWAGLGADNQFGTWALEVSFSCCSSCRFSIGWEFGARFWHLPVGFE